MTLEEALKRFPHGLKLKGRQHLVHDAPTGGMRVGTWPHIANFSHEEDAEAIVLIVNHLLGED